MSDAELERLLLVEISRHLATLEGKPLDVVEARRALHALKGSLGLAGETALAQEIAREERRLASGDEMAAHDAAALMRRVEERLLAGEPASDGVLSWPIPPPALIARAVDPSLRAQYVAEVGDRLSRIDEALSGAVEPVEAATLAYRSVHTMKGAASAVSDETMAWFCHGLEEQLKGVGTPDAARRALSELSKHRGMLGALLDDPVSALASLRSRGRSAAPSTVPPQSSIVGDATIRVEAQAVDRLIERNTTVAVAREAMVQTGHLMLQRSAEMRSLRGELAEALRLIGPPRPWGAPAAALSRVRSVADALAATSERLEESAASVRVPELSLREAELASKRELSAMRQMPLRTLFARLGAAVLAEAKRSGREIHVTESGASETVDRRLAEALLEPCLQIARNAVAHGIELPDERERTCKPRAGTLVFSARKAAGRLRITLSDDGRGVDGADVRKRAVVAGLLAHAVAARADDDALLELLFMPGFTTRDASDWLAGRGIGLDIALASVQRLGGRIHLSSQKGVGLSAAVDVPVESGFAKVLWVEARGERYAFVATDVSSIRRASSASAPHLVTCIDHRQASAAAGPIVLELAGPSPAFVSVDAALALEELLVRPLTAVVAAMGPFAGAVVRGDGSVRLALDAHALGPRARALAAAAGSAYSP